MFMRFGSNLEASLRRLRMSGVLLDGPEGSFDVLDSGIELTAFDADVETGELQSKAVVTVNKNCLVVSINPAIGALLGYQPAAPSILYAGEFAQLVVNTQGIEPDDLAELAKVTWLARLHYVVIGNYES